MVRHRGLLGLHYYSCKRLLPVTLRLRAPGFWKCSAREDCISKFKKLECSNLDTSSPDRCRGPSFLVSLASDVLSACSSTTPQPPSQHLSHSYDMGSSASKGARAAGAAGVRKYPSRPAPSTTRAPAPAPAAAPAPPRSNVGPQATGSRTEGM